MRKFSRRTQYTLMIFLILTTAYTYFYPKTNWNSGSRIALTRAIVEEGVFYIDSYHKVTGDKAFVDGHYYTDKSIGPSILATIPYFVYHHLTSLPPLNSLHNEKLIPVITTWFSVALPSGLFGAIFFLLMSKFTPKVWYAVLATLAYGLGTMTFPFSIAIFQHQLAAIGLFSAFIILWHIIYEDANVYWLWLVGILTGLVMISDYFSGLLMCCILVWSLYKMKDWLSLIPIIVGALPFLILFFMYNMVCFGGPLALGYSYQPEWAAVQEQGFFGLTRPTIRSLWGITFSSFRGLFYMSPYLLLGFHGLYIMWRERFERSVIILFSIVIVSTFLYGASYVMWWGGWSDGPRHIIPVLPFLAFPTVFAFRYWMRHKWARLVVFLLVGMSFANVWIQTLATNTYMPDFLYGAPPDVLAGDWILLQYDLGYLYNNPILDYAIPRIAAGDFTDTLMTDHWDVENFATVLLPLFFIWVFILFGFLISSRYTSPEEIPSLTHST